MFPARVVFETTCTNILFYLCILIKKFRYPDDVYDRRWYPMFLENRWKPVTTDINVNTNNTYNPPQKAMATAATSLDVNAPWNITWSVEPPSTKFYLYIHFAELQSLGSNNTREFNVILNGNLYFGPYSPKPLKTETIYGKTPDQCDGGKCILQLEKTSKSTLQPLINAIEGYTVIDFPQLETNSDEGMQ